MDPQTWSYTYRLIGIGDVAWACVGFAFAFAVFTATVVGIIAYIRGELSYRDREE